MTDREMIQAYKREIRKAGGVVPETRGREVSMQIAKVQDVWKRCRK